MPSARHLFGTASLASSALSASAELLVLCSCGAVFAVYLLVVTLQKKLSSGSHEIPLTKNRTVGVIPTSRHWGRGGLHCFCTGAKNPSYATANGWLADLAAGLRLCRPIPEWIVYINESVSLAVFN